jgi:acetylornithine deacetylase/succinyl-diaminopimelate desuccinylase-like protein
VRSIGSGTLSDRVWAGPAVSVLGIDAPAIHGSSNQIVPVARARVSLRLAPGDDAAAGRRRLIAHLREHAPWGVEVSIPDEGGAFEAGQGHLVDTGSAAFSAARAALTEAYGTEPLEVGSGGSIPLVPMLVDTFPGIAVLILGASDERSNVHSVNESVDLGDLERSALAEALFISRLGGVAS